MLQPIVNQFAFGFRNSLPYARLPWTNIPYQPVKVTITSEITAFSILLHFSVHHWYRSLIIILIGWLLRNLRVIVCLLKEMDPLATNIATKFNDIHCFWVLHDSEPYLKTVKQFWASDRLIVFARILGILLEGSNWN